MTSTMPTMTAAAVRRSATVPAYARHRHAEEQSPLIIPRSDRGKN
jgi:hypothetical protein